MSDEKVSDIKTLKEMLCKDRRLVIIGHKGTLDFDVFIRLETQPVKCEKCGEEYEKNVVSRKDMLDLIKSMVTDDIIVEPHCHSKHKICIKKV